MKTWLAVLAVMGLCIGVAEAAAPSSPTFTVRVATDPADAMISIDGVTRDVAPLVVTNLAAGEHLFVARKAGHRDARKTLTLGSDSKVSLEMKLEPLTGLVLIHSIPSGAEVRIDDVDRGKTPLLIPDLPLGKHRLRVTSPKYRQNDSDLEVTDRSPLKVDVVLTSNASTLMISSEPAGATVVLNGVSKGTTPVTIDDIQEGESRLEMTLEGYEPFTKAIRLSAGQREEVKCVLKMIPAELTLVSLPAKARMYVDNQFRGEAPVSLTGLAPAEYRIRAELVGHEPVARTVVLKAAQKLTEEFRLEANDAKLQITTQPPGVKVFIADILAGTTLPKKDEMDPVSEPLIVVLPSLGEHQVKLVRKGYFDITFPITAEKSKTVTANHVLKRNFVPDYEVRTTRETYTGVMIEEDVLGNVKLEIRPGIFKTIPLREIKSKRPLQPEVPK